MFAKGRELQIIKERREADPARMVIPLGWNGEGLGGCVGPYHKG